MQKHSTAVVPFTFESSPIRVVTEGDGEPMFVAKDLVEAVDAVWKGDQGSLPHVPDEWKGVTSVQTPGGRQEMTVLTEQGMYFYLIRSDKPKALPLQKWVSGQVLPSIRRTGGYAVRPVLAEKPTQIFKDFYGIGKLIGLDKAAAALAANNATVKVASVNVLELMGATHLESESQEHWFTPTELGRLISVSARAFNLLLAEAGLQNSESGQWVPTDQAQGLCRIMDTGKHHHGGTMVTQLKWSRDVLGHLGRVAA